MDFFPVVVVIIIILGSSSTARQMVAYIFGYSINPIGNKLNSSYIAILEKTFPYYQKLNTKKRNVFQRRLRYFLSSKEFIPKGMNKITSEMRFLIGACAVQLTFGLPPLRLAHFNKILVYPDKYSSQNGNLHKGEVNPKYKIIVLSWKDFIEGYATPDDSFNVGLHEFAHALKIEDSIRNEEYNFFDTKLIGELYKEFNKIKSSISEGEHLLLRKYAATNFDEFFAVCVEYFFEKPLELYKSEGGVYTILRLMLKQDTRNVA